MIDCETTFKGEKYSKFFGDVSSSRPDLPFLSRSSTNEYFGIILKILCNTQFTKAEVHMIQHPTFFFLYLYYQVFFTHTILCVTSAVSYAYLCMSSVYRESQQSVLEKCLQMCKMYIQVYVCIVHTKQVSTYIHTRKKGKNF